MKKEQQINKKNQKKTKKTNNSINSKYLEVAQKVDINQKTFSYIKQVNKELNVNLEKLALKDEERSFSYGQMYEEWDKYAKTFNSLKINDKNKSRVLIFGSMSLSVTLCYYGLNIVGAQISIIPEVSLLNFDKVVQTIKSEKITDVIIPDTLLREEVLKSLLKEKDELGLRNVMLLNVSVKSVAVPKVVTMFLEKKNNIFKLKYKDLYLDKYLHLYQNEKLNLINNNSKDISVILHTSGTTSGCGKPVVQSDKSTNAKCRSILALEGYDFLKEDLITSITVDLSNGYSLSNQLNPFLAVGATIIFVPFGVLNPFLASAVDKYKFTALFTVGPALEGWSKMPGNNLYDFTSLKAIVVGGSPFTIKDRVNNQKFFKSIKGENTKIINGYGLTELGGACTLSEVDEEDDSIGKVMPGIKIKMMDEDTGKFINESILPRTGVLYINSDAATSGILDDKQIIEFEEIDGEKYLCTNDVVQMDKDGRLHYICRANRFFVNNGTISYNANKVEKEINKLGILDRNIIISDYDKNLHDTLPLLCVESKLSEDETLENVKEVLKKSFGPRKLKLDQIPRKLFITQELVKNANGKIDLFKLKMGKVAGKKYDIELILDKKKIVDIDFKTIEENSNYLYDYTKQIVDDVVGGLIADFIPRTWLTHKNLPWLEIASLLGESDSPDDFKKKIQSFLFSHIDLFNDQMEKFKDIQTKILNNEFNVEYLKYLNDEANKMIFNYVDMYNRYQQNMYNYYRNLNNMFDIVSLFKSFGSNK